MLAQAFRHLVELLYPNLCLACGAHLSVHESSLCISCSYKISPTNYHKMEDNPVLERFWGRLQLAHASSSFTFVKGGLLQQLLHQLKYEQQPQIGIELGRMYGSYLKGVSPYDSVSLVVPVPLHPKKALQRGYNQAAKFAEGIAEVLEVPWSENYLKRAIYTETQTKKTREERFDNVAAAFQLQRAQELEGAHILLVDDVITTGATLEACALQFKAIPDLKLSIGAIALAN